MYVYWYAWKLLPDGNARSSGRKKGANIVAKAMTAPRTDPKKMFGKETFLRNGFGSNHSAFSISSSNSTISSGNNSGVRKRERSLLRGFSFEPSSPFGGFAMRTRSFTNLPADWVFVLRKDVLLAGVKRGLFCLRDDWTTKATVSVESSIIVNSIAQNLWKFRIMAIVGCTEC